MTLFEDFLYSAHNYYAQIWILDKSGYILREAFTDEQLRIHMDYLKIAPEGVPNKLWAPDEGLPRNFPDYKVIETCDYDESEFEITDPRDFKWSPEEFFRNCLCDMASRDEEIILYAEVPVRSDADQWYLEVFDGLIIPMMVKAGIQRDKIRTSHRNWTYQALSLLEPNGAELDITIQGPIGYFMLLNIAEYFDTKFLENDTYYNLLLEEIPNFNERIEVLKKKKFDYSIEYNGATGILRVGPHEIATTLKKFAEFICDKVNIPGLITVRGDQELRAKFINFVDNDLMNEGELQKFFFSSYMAPSLANP